MNRATLLTFMWMFLLASAAPGMGAAEAAKPHLALEPLDDGRSVRLVAVLPDAVAAQMPHGAIEQRLGSAWLWLSLLDEQGGEGPAIFGDYRRDGLTLTFTPRFSLLPGRRYRAVFWVPQVRVGQEDFIVPAAQANVSQPKVEAVYPSGDQVPANLLKFYIYFAQPMRRTELIFDQVHVIDDTAGAEVMEPWRRLALWSDDARRLTMWVHPGRVKQGVNLREEEGPVLRPGRAYRLVIDADVLDAEGRPLGEPVVKRFTATAEDHDRPDVSAWKIDAPQAGPGATEPLRIHFPEPLDYSLLQRMITVRIAGQGKPIAGRVEVVDAERTWLFTPAETWNLAEHAITVDPTMEDLAGNTAERVFDTDLGAGEATPLPTRRTFTPRPAAPAASTAAP